MQGIYHRDINPAKLFRYDGAPVLAGFGWCAGPTEPGNLFVMFFQPPIYE